MAHWHLRISKFLLDMKLAYKPGVVNIVADVLSRPFTSSEMIGGEKGSDVQKVLHPDLRTSTIDAKSTGRAK